MIHLLVSCPGLKIRLQNPVLHSTSPVKLNHQMIECYIALAHVSETNTNEIEYANGEEACLEAQARHIGQFQRKMILATTEGVCNFIIFAMSHAVLA